MSMNEIIFSNGRRILVLSQMLSNCDKWDMRSDVMDLRWVQMKQTRPRTLLIYNMPVKKNTETCGKKVRSMWSFVYDHYYTHNLIGHGQRYNHFGPGTHYAKRQTPIVNHPYTQKSHSIAQLHHGNKSFRCVSYWLSLDESWWQRSIASLTCNLVWTMSSRGVLVPRNTILIEPW